MTLGKFEVKIFAPISLSPLKILWWFGKVDFSIFSLLIFRRFGLIVCNASKISQSLLKSKKSLFYLKWCFLFFSFKKIWVFRVSSRVCSDLKKTCLISQLGGVRKEHFYILLTFFYQPRIARTFIDTHAYKKIPTARASAPVLLSLRRALTKFFYKANLVLQIALSIGAPPRNNLTSTLAVIPAANSRLHGRRNLITLLSPSRATLGLSFSRITVPPRARVRKLHYGEWRAALSLRHNQLLLNGVFARSIGQTRSDQARVRPPRYP